MTFFGKVVFLSGGVGGARLLHGVAEVLLPEQLTVVVNTGDDFVHWGLRICPDLDTVMYTLAELADEARGWGLRDETFQALERMRVLGAEAWFALGDKDLATHLRRTEALHAGQSLTQVTRHVMQRLGVKPQVLPMCDGPRPTFIDTFEQGELPFQRWLVEQHAPKVRSVRFGGEPVASPETLAALAQAELILIGPSNPYVSIDPILSLHGVREAMREKLVLAVSPIVGGRAVKGPLAEMIPTLAGRAASAQAIVAHYAGLLSGIVVEHGDVEACRSEQHATQIEGIPCHAADTIMAGKESRVALAREVLAFAARLHSARAPR